MRNALIAGMLAVAAAVWAQEAPKPAQEAAKPGLTAEQIIDKSIEATGGRVAMEKITSRVMKGSVDVMFAGVTAEMSIYAKAPNKTVSIVNVEGYGQVRNGFDGSVGWSDTPEQGLRELSGEMLDQAKRQAIFNAELKWRELYPKAEVKGKEKVGERDAFVVVLSPTKGKPVTQYFDAENFLLLRQIMPQITDQGEFDIKTEFADYRPVDGVKVPFQVRQTIPPGDIALKITEVKHNVDIEDTTFAKPAPK